MPPRCWSLHRASLLHHRAGDLRARTMQRSVPADAGAAAAGGESFEVFHVKRALASGGAADFSATYLADDACIMRYTAASTPHPALTKERAAERDKNARAISRLAECRAVEEACSGVATAPSSSRYCIVLRLPPPTLARIGQLVRLCSAQQGGGACAVMVVQADGQVLQFSVASVAQLAPLQKSALKHPESASAHRGLETKERGRGPQCRAAAGTAQGAGKKRNACREGQPALEQGAHRRVAAAEAVSGYDN